MSKLLKFEIQYQTITILIGYQPNQELVDMLSILKSKPTLCEYIVFDIL